MQASRWSISISYRAILLGGRASRISWTMPDGAERQEYRQGQRRKARWRISCSQVVPLVCRKVRARGGNGCTVLTGRIAVMITHANIADMIMCGATSRVVDELYLKVRAIFSQARNTLTVLSSQPKELPPPVSLLALPLNHAYGIFMCCMRPYATPSTVVYLPRWDTLTVLRPIERSV